MVLTKKYPPEPYTEVEEGSRWHVHALSCPYGCQAGIGRSGVTAPLIYDLVI